MPDRAAGRAILDLADAVAAACGAADPKPAIAAAASTPIVASHEPRASQDGSIWAVTVRLAATSTATIDDVWKILDAEKGGRLPPPFPQLVSPSNVPQHAWGDLPVSYKLDRPWGTLVCERAYSDSGGRIRSFMVRVDGKR